MKNKIEQLINNNKIFLFMKGTPEEPQCGFSFHVIQILRNLDVEYGYFNVLSDDVMREAVKEYAKGHYAWWQQVGKQQGVGGTKSKDSIIAALKKKLESE